MSKLKGKFVEDSTITDLQIRLRNNLALRARNAANSADVSLFKLSATDVLEALREMSMSSNKLINLADPTAAQDAATKAYVDSIIAGLRDPKDAVKAATTAALPAVTYDNGTAGVGATLTADANGAFPSQDGIAILLDERVLTKNQVVAFQNGLYSLTQVGDGSNPFILTRTTDADNGGGNTTKVTQGMVVPVSAGTTQGTLGFILTSISSGGDPQGDLVLGTDALNFSQFGEVIQPGLGIAKNGQTISVDNGDGLGFSGNNLVVLVNDNLVTGSTKISGGVVASRKSFENSFTLNGTDISNGYVDLDKVASQDSEVVFPRFGIKQKQNVDWTPSYTGGAGGKTRITFAGDLATLLVSGDILDIRFESLDF